MTTTKHCASCHDDYYNRTRCGLNEKSGEPRCWHLATAVMVKALDVPVDMPPPYLSLRETKRPSCYKANGYVRVKRESLTAAGYWR